MFDTPAERCAAQPAAPTPDYYYTYHAAQQEEARPNLCLACNGTGFDIWLDGPDDCIPCDGEGTLSRPYTERDLWIDEVCHDTYTMLREAGFNA